MTGWERTVSGASSDAAGTLLTLQPSPSSSHLRYDHHHHKHHHHHHRHPSKGTTSRHGELIDDNNNNNGSSSAYSSSSSSSSTSSLCHYYCCCCCCCCYGCSSSSSGGGYNSIIKRSSSVPRDSVFDAGLRASAATGGGRNIGISGSSVTGTGIGTTGTGDNGGSGGGTPWLNSSGATFDNHHVRFKRNHHHCCTRTGQGAMKSSGKVNKAPTKARKCRKGLYASRRSSDGGIGAGEEGAGADSEEDVERRLKRLEDAIFLL